MLHLERLTGKNVWEVLRLSVEDYQKNFVAPNDMSLVEAYIAITNHGYALPFGLYDGSTPVGFLMLSYDAEDCWEDAPQIAHGNYSIWRLMIDKNYQHRGYGKQAMELALDYLRTKPCGEAEYCWLSYEPTNEVARKLYASFGFRETGEYDGDEVIAAREL